MKNAERKELHGEKYTAANSLGAINAIGHPSKQPRDPIPNNHKLDFQ